MKCRRNLMESLRISMGFHGIPMEFSRNRIQSHGISIAFYANSMKCHEDFMKNSKNSIELQWSPWKPIVFCEFHRNHWNSMEVYWFYGFPSNFVEIPLTSMEFYVRLLNAVIKLLKLITAINFSDEFQY